MYRHGELGTILDRVGKRGRKRNVRHARLRNVGGTPEADPASVEEAFALQLQKLGRAVEPGGQRACLRESAPRGLVEFCQEFW